MLVIWETAEACTARSPHPIPSHLHLPGLLPSQGRRQDLPMPRLVPAVFKDALYFVLVSPRVVRGRVRTVISQMRSCVLGRFRPGSGGKLTFYFDFGLKRSWA